MKKPENHMEDNNATDAIEYINRKIKDWNQGVEITKSQLEFWPFLICVAGNGGTKKLYDAFGPFYSYPEGAKSEIFNDALYLGKKYKSRKIALNAELIVAIDKSIDLLRTEVDQDLPSYSTLDLLLFCHQLNCYNRYLGADNCQIPYSDIEDDILAKYWQKNYSDKQPS